MLDELNKQVGAKKKNHLNFFQPYSKLKKVAGLNWNSSNQDEEESRFERCFRSEVLISIL